MEPTGIGPVTSCLQSMFAEDLQKARILGKSRCQCHLAGDPMVPNRGSISMRLGTGSWPVPNENRASWHRAQARPRL